MRKGWMLAAAASVWLGACDDGNSVNDAGVDTGVPADLGVIIDVGFAPDFGLPDSGRQGKVDAGFLDPATLAQGKEILNTVETYIHVRGTLTSTMPPVIVLSTGPMHGLEYLTEPTEFLLGPGGPQNPNRLVAYFDMRGTGRSGQGSLMEPGITVENHVKDLQNIIDYVHGVLGSTPKVDLVGHGYGAGIAVLYAADNGDKVSRMVLSNPHPVDIKDHARWNENYRARLTSSELERMRMVTEWSQCLRDLLRCSKETWEIFGPTWLCPENRQVFDDMTFDHLDFRPYGYFISRELRDTQYDWSIAAGKVTIPTTVISGPCDPIPEHTPLTFTASISGSVHHVVPGSGHFTMSEKPAEFQRIVKRALTY